jgi:hypothetical protein
VRELPSVEEFTQLSGVRPMGTAGFKRPALALGRLDPITPRFTMDDSTLRRLTCRDCSQ